MKKLPKSFFNIDGIYELVHPKFEMMANRQIQLNLNRNNFSVPDLCCIERTVNSRKTHFFHHIVGLDFSKGVADAFGDYFRSLLDRASEPGEIQSATFYTYNPISQADFVVFIEPGKPAQVQYKHIVPQKDKKEADIDKARFHEELVMCNFARINSGRFKWESYPTLYFLYKDNFYDFFFSESKVLNLIRKHAIRNPAYLKSLTSTFRGYEICFPTTTKNILIETLWIIFKRDKRLSLFIKYLCGFLPASVKRCIEREVNDEEMCIARQRILDRARSDILSMGQEKFFDLLEFVIPIARSLLKLEKRQSALRILQVTKFIWSNICPEGYSFPNIEYTKMYVKILEACGNYREMRDLSEELLTLSSYDPMTVLLLSKSLIRLGKMHKGLAVLNIIPYKTVVDSMLISINNSLSLPRNRIYTNPRTVSYSLPAGTPKLSRSFDLKIAKVLRMALDSLGERKFIDFYRASLRRETSYRVSKPRVPGTSGLIVKISEEKPDVEFEDEKSEEVTYESMKRKKVDEVYNSIILQKNGYASTFDPDTIQGMQNQYMMSDIRGMSKLSQRNAATRLSGVPSVRREPLERAIEYGKIPSLISVDIQEIKPKEWLNTLIKAFLKDMSRLVEYKNFKKKSNLSLDTLIEIRNASQRVDARDAFISSSLYLITKLRKGEKKILCDLLAIYSRDRKREIRNSIRLIGMLISEEDAEKPTMKLRHRVFRTVRDSLSNLIFLHGYQRTRRVVERNKKPYKETILFYLDILEKRDIDQLV